MLNKILDIFSKSKPIKNTVHIEESMDLTSYFREELVKSSYIKSDCHEQVLAHLLHKTSLTKTGNKLTAEEKKTLGINPRLAITHELVAVLTKEGLVQKDPKRVLNSIYYRATFKEIRLKNLSKWKNMGVNSVCFLSVNDERECIWCKNQGGKDFSIKTDFDELIEKNCTCDSHCRAVLLANI